MRNYVYFTEQEKTMLDGETIVIPLMYFCALQRENELLNSMIDAEHLEAGKAQKEARQLREDLEIANKLLEEKNHIISRLQAEIDALDTPPDYGCLLDDGEPGLAPAEEGDGSQE